ncbi:MAG: MFS transporter [Candidatus Aquicultorales bacterium]
MASRQGPLTEGSLAESSAAEVGRRKLFEGITGNVVVVGTVSLLTDISSEMIYPLMPLFLTTVLGAPVSAIGIIEGIAESTAGILKMFSGWLSDRLGKRKQLIVTGYGISNLIKPLLYLATAWPQVLFLRFLDRVGKGIRTAPRDAIVADSTDSRSRGRAFGFHRAMDTVGAAVGPLLALAVLSFIPGESGLRTAFLIAAVPGTIAVLVAAKFLRERRPSGEERALPKIGFKGLPRNFKIFSLIALVFAAGNFSDAFLILRARDVGMAMALIPLAYFVFNIAHAVFAFPLGAVSDRLGRRRVIVLGYLIFSAVYLGFALASSPAHAWFLFIAYGLYYAATEGVQRAFIGDLVAEGSRATAMGTFNALTGLALLPASLIAGTLWEAVGPQAAFLYGSALSLTAAALLTVVRLRD